MTNRSWAAGDQTVTSPDVSLWEAVQGWGAPESGVVWINDSAPGRVGRGQQFPSWRRARRLLGSLTKLVQGWDGHDGLPAAPQAVDAAWSFLTTVGRAATGCPDTHPTPDGGILLEWHYGSVDIEITFPPTDPPTLFFSDGDRLEWEGQLRASPFAVAHILEGLGERFPDDDAPEEA